MSKPNKPHFWIPDNEVESISKLPQARSKPKKLNFSEHGQKLCRSLERIRKTLEESSEDNSLADTGRQVFKIRLHEDDKVQGQVKLLEDSGGLSIHAVRDDRTAVVSSPRERFEKLVEKAKKYRTTGEGKTFCEVIDDFAPIEDEERESASLKKQLESVPPNVDIQIMLLPSST